MQIRKFSESLKSFGRKVEWNKSHRHLGEDNGLSYLRAWEMLGRCLGDVWRGNKEHRETVAFRMWRSRSNMTQRICLPSRLPAAVNVSGLIQVFSTQSPKPVWRLPHNCRACLVQAARFCHYFCFGSGFVFHQRCSHTSSVQPSKNKWFPCLFR